VVRRVTDDHEVPPVRLPRQLVRGAKERGVILRGTDVAERTHEDRVVGEPQVPPKRAVAPWRELLAVATRGHRQVLDDFESNRRDFTQYIERLLRAYVDKGQLSPTLPVEVAVDIVYAVNAFDFREYCAAKRMKPPDVLTQARRQMKLLVQDWRPRPHDVRRLKPAPRRKA